MLRECENHATELGVRQNQHQFLPAERVLRHFEGRKLLLRFGRVKIQYVPAKGRLRSCSCVNVSVACGEAFGVHVPLW